MHTYIGTDNGLECYGCGLVLDYAPLDDDGRAIYGPTYDALEDAARSLAFGLHGRIPERAHHYVLEGRPDGGYVLVCAYDSTTVDELTSPADVNPECVGG